MQDRRTTGASDPGSKASERVDVSIAFRIRALRNGEKRTDRATGLIPEGTFECCGEPFCFATSESGPTP